ncbi:MAG TPA: alpha/beta hydrolase-fold protein [Planctomycetota bacterium]|nr:alpha/beta hydrolase-fold protein [Planctomycetota bacterium]
MSVLAWTLALACLAAQDPSPAPAVSEALECDSALAQLVDAPTREARRSIAASLARGKHHDVEVWAAAMARLGSFETAKTGVHAEKVELQVQGKREETELWIYVPAKYDPAKPAPLMLAFHGTGGSGQGMHHRWQMTAEELGMLVLSPSEAGDNSGYHFNDRERAAALAALRWMRRHYNVDENRVVASGISRGGHLSWDLALRYPDLFSAAVPLIGSPRITLVAGQNNMRLLENVAQLSIRDLQGAKDDPGLVYSVRLAFELLGRFAPRDAKKIEFPELGHDFEMSAVDWPQFLSSALRDPWPERVVRCTATKDEGRAAWLEILSVSKDVQEVFPLEIPQGERLRMSDNEVRQRAVVEAVKHNARAVARRTSAGVFSLELDGATKVRLYLRGEDLASNGKLKISLDGKLLERSARPDSKAMLEEFAERFDRTAIIRSQVEVP